MKIGFTGTRERLTADQYAALFGFIQAVPPAEFHHGCCLGADASAVDMVDRVHGRAVIVGHPGDMPDFTSSNCLRLSDELRPAKNNLARNRDIVSECEVLLACPKGPEQVKGSGTWATVRYARKAGKRVVIFWPDGTITDES